ncbi:MAG: hypothetical protein ACE5JS_22610 [Nitrospinota bacterium]
MGEVPKIETISADLSCPEEGNFLPGEVHAVDPLGRPAEREEAS